jgi:hypothetical protein
MTMISQGFCRFFPLDTYLSTGRSQSRRRITGRASASSLLSAAKRNAPIFTSRVLIYSTRPNALANILRREAGKRPFFPTIASETGRPREIILKSNSKYTDIHWQDFRKRAVKILVQFQCFATVCGEGALATRNKLPYPWSGIRGWVRAAFSGGMKCYQFARGSR